MLQLILIGGAFILLSGNYWGHISWTYNLHPALSGAICILTFLIRPANNQLVTHDPMTHKLLVALSVLFRGGRPEEEERIPLEGTKQPPPKDREITHHDEEDLSAYKYP